MSIIISHNNDVLYNSIKVQNTDIGSFYEYINTQSLYLTKNVRYEITYKMYTQGTSSAPFDIYFTSSNGNLPFTRTDSHGYLINKVTASLNTFTEKSHIITPTINGTGSISFLFKYGTYYISDINVKPYQRNNFSLGEMELIVPSPPSNRTEPVSITPVYIGRNGKPVGNTDVTLVNAGKSGNFSRYTMITGSNLVISYDDNLIEGSLFVGKNLRTGVEISGFDNAMIRSVGYAGYNNATQYNWPGFMLYSGSVLPGSGDNYRGVGLELHGGGNSGSLRYRVDDSGSFLEITGSIYATSGYFAGIISASIGGYIANWEITENDLRSISNYGGIKLNSSIPAIQFYSESKTWVSIESLTTDVSTYGGVTESISAAYYNIGNRDVHNEYGASLFFDFGYGNATVSNGNFIILDANRIVFNANSASIFESDVIFTKPISISGNKSKGHTGRMILSWNSEDVPYMPSIGQFCSVLQSGIRSGNDGLSWISGSLHSNAAIYGINYNYMGQKIPPTFDTIYSGSTIRDIINAGVVGYNSRGQGSGIKCGVYARTNASPSTETINGSSTALLVDAYPGKSGKSAVFRWGRFYVGDPWNNYNGSKKIVLFVDGSPEFRGTPNTGFQRVGINTYTPNCELHVVGDIYATGDITAFSDVRKKTNINTIENSLNIIGAMRGVRFQFKSGSEHPNNELVNRKNHDKIHVGLIAQEVETVLPEVVSTSDDGYKSINYANIVSVLINAINEQQQQINDLKDEISRIKNA